MTPAVVVDIGNTRMKWGRVADGVVADFVSLDLNDPLQWDAQLDSWQIPKDPWLISSVVPSAQQRLVDWLRKRNIQYTLLTNELFLSKVKDFCTQVSEPQAMGMDRLLNSYSAIRKVDFECSVAAIGVGTAMTVDFVREEGTHFGGAILPGMRLMSRALHEHTAMLPLLDYYPQSVGLAWGQNTRECIETGIYHALLGAADQLMMDWTAEDYLVHIFITGGDCWLFHNFTFSKPNRGVSIEGKLTLDGLVFAAEHLP